MKGVGRERSEDEQEKKMEYMEYKEANDISVTMQEESDQISVPKINDEKGWRAGLGGREEDLSRLEKLEEDVGCPL